MSGLNLVLFTLALRKLNPLRTENVTEFEGEDFVEIYVKSIIIKFKAKNSH
jgi:hypothetical protein